MAARDQRAAAEQNDTSEASAAPDEPAERQQPEDGIGPSALPVAQVEETGTRPLTASDVPALAPQRSLRGLAAAALRDVGRVRQINQDSVFALLTTVPRESGDISIGLFIVADGMGGHQGGEVASRMAISAVARHVLTELLIPALIDGSAEAIQPLIITAVQDANRAIWEHAQAIGSDMGTTCTVVLLLGRALYIGHVGDSRAYLATPAELKQITSDHSTVGRLIQLGQLDPAEVREHPLRSQLYRTIGQQREVLVDFTYQQLGDATHLLVCSDGLWGMIGDEAMLDVVQQHTWPQDACNELIARANLAGGEDNISAIVVSLPSSSQ
ncbi:MAG: serine/threonine-protein phosphatase [Kouleothrix sp.]|nr:serine/threonine-protein phosphatase [Kouleothrix sp.]